MRLIYNSIFLEHDTGMHPENAKRLMALGEIPETRIESGEAYLELIHTPDYIKKVKEACKTQAHLDSDTATSLKSYEAAIHAVGATLMAAETGDFAVVRPPGHHAYPERASGFCLFNNVAIAAQKLANEGKRVLIFDFDGHLGDGTSKIFYNTDKVLYWSIHQYPAFPGHGYVNEIGEGPGKGFTINVPLPPHSGDDIFMDAIDSILPIVEQFQPDVVAVSAGFDAHMYDLLLDLRVTTGSFYKIGNLLRQKFDRLFATLEGGYNVEELPKCLNSFLAGINDKKIPSPQPETESDIKVWDEYEIGLHSLLGLLNNHWKV